MSKRLLLIYDVPGWTWHRRTQDLQSYAPADYEVAIISQDRFAQHAALPGYFDDLDAVLSMSWPCCRMDLLAKAKRSVVLVTCAGLLYDRVRENDWNTWVVTSSRNAPNARNRLHRFDGVIAVNRELHDAAVAMNPAAVLLPSGVNHEFYRPGPIRTDPIRPLRVGWCANPRGQRSVKGFNEVLTPLRNLLGDTEFEWVVNDRHVCTPEGALNREEMVGWYHGVDVFICTSINDGTPSPIFEAACTGRTIVSTDVGVVHDWPEPHELGLVAPAYHSRETANATIQAMADTLRTLHAHRDQLVTFGHVLQQSAARRYGWDTLAPKYLRYIAGDPL